LEYTSEVRGLISLYYLLFLSPATSTFKNQVIFYSLLLLWCSPVTFWASQKLNQNSEALRAPWLDKQSYWPLAPVTRVQKRFAKPLGNACNAGYKIPRNDGKMRESLGRSIIFKIKFIPFTNFLS